MQMTEIRKESIGEVSGVNEALCGLAESAKTILGYDALSKIMAKPSLAEMTELQAALKELDIEVLNASDVLQYQKERLIEHTADLLKKWMQDSSTWTELKWWQSFSGPRWEHSKISEYHEPVPEFVIAKALQIKQRIPECEIYITHLVDHPDPFLVISMGVSAYSQELPKESYYVEVWDEPKFEGRIR